MKRDPSHTLDSGTEVQTIRRAPAPGQAAVLLAGLAIGALLMSVQLWLLTVALDLYLGGSENGIWPLAVISGLVFLGGILAASLIGRN
jgi:hypothetical protein